MEYRSTFQSIISLHQEELSLNLREREQKLPINEERIVTVTGIRRCGKSSLLGLAINQLIENLFCESDAHSAVIIFTNAFICLKCGIITSATIVPPVFIS